MSFWSGETLQKRLPTLIAPFDAKAIDCAAYTLSLGGHAFTSGDDDDRQAAHKRGKTPGVVKLEPGETVTIRSGQFALLLTEETVTIPHDAVGFISVKATHKFEGLINVSGFHVDPGWSSPLIFGVFNAGPRELVFQRGQQLFLLFYAALDKETNELYQGKAFYPFKNIPPEFIENMAGDVPSLYKLSKTLQQAETKINEIGVRATAATLSAGVALFLAGLVFTKVIVFGSVSTATTPAATPPPASHEPPSMPQAEAPVQQPEQTPAPSPAAEPAAGPPPVTQTPDAKKAEDAKKAAPAPAGK